MEGYIRLHRKFTEWEWYTDEKTKTVFLHLLLTANWKEGRFRGQVVPRGSVVTSIGKISDDTGLTVNEVRTALKHLENTGEINKQTTNRFSLISVQNYNLYQDDSQASHKQSTSKAQSNHNQLTTIEKRKKVIKKEIENTSYSCAESEKPTSTLIVKIPLNDGTEYPVYENDIGDWVKAYPAVDVRQELLKMRSWCNDNPRMRKTKGGVKRFIGNWLSRTQNQGGTRVKRSDGNMDYLNKYREGNT